MKNDVSFIILNEMNLWEHQSTFSPNMPMRFFYTVRLYEKFIANTDCYPYSRTPQPVTFDGEIATLVNSEDKQALIRRYTDVSWNSRNDCVNTTEL